MRIYHFKVRLKDTTWINIDEVTEKLVKIYVFDCLITTSGMRCTLRFDREGEDLWSTIESALFDIAKAGLIPYKVEFNVLHNGIGDE